MKPFFTTELPDDAVVMSGLRPVSQIAYYDIIRSTSAFALLQISTDGEASKKTCSVLLLVVKFHNMNPADITTRRLSVAAERH